MSEDKVAAKAQAEIPYGLLEYTAVFGRPIVEAWEIRSKIIAAVLDALNPWGFKLDGVEIKARAEKLVEDGIVFRRTSPATPAMSLALGFGKVFVSAENLDWTEAEHFIAGISAGLNAVLQTAKPEIESQHIALGMHIQVNTKPRKDVTAPLLSPSAFQLLDGDVKFPGIILNREKSSIIIDASAAYANGLFVRMFREHPPDATFQQMADVLRRDEQQLFEVLGLEGVL